MNDDDKSEIYRQAGFKPGDVIRSRDGKSVGVVLYVDRTWDDPPTYELFADIPDQGVGIWPPEEAVLANDPQSVAEARRLGLRGLVPNDETTSPEAGFA